MAARWRDPSARAIARVGSYLGCPAAGSPIVGSAARFEALARPLGPPACPGSTSFPLSPPLAFGCSGGCCCCCCCGLACACLGAMVGEYPDLREGRRGAGVGPRGITERVTLETQHSRQAEEPVRTTRARRTAHSAAQRTRPTRVRGATAARDERRARRTHNRPGERRCVRLHVEIDGRFPAGR